MVALIITTDEWQQFKAEQEELRQELERLRNWPLIMNWVSPAFASKFLDKDEDTLKKMRERGEISYLKDTKKVQYYLPSLVAYLDRKHIKKEVINKRLQSLSKSVAA